MNEKWYNVGKVVNTHGIRGELKVLSQTDFPERRFAPGSVLRLINEESGKSLEVRIASARVQKNMYIIKFEDVHNINDVEKYKGWSLKISEQDQEKLEDGQYYYHEIIGCQVVMNTGEELGTITEILSPGANDVWVVERPQDAGKPILLPVIDDVILQVNVHEKRITVQLMEGLI